MQSTRLGKTKLNETFKALKSIKNNGIKSAFKSQLYLAEGALERKNNTQSKVYLENLAASVLMLRKNLTPKVVSNLLQGIIIDAQTNALQLDNLIYTNGARCSRGESCLKARYTRCLTIEGVGGCGTVPKLILSNF